MEHNFPPLELFADDVAGVLFGLNTSKVIFTSMQPQREGAHTEKDVLNLVMPTDALLSFCLYVLSGFAKNGLEIGQYTTERGGELSAKLAAVKELVASEIYKKLDDEEDEEIEQPKPTPKKRSRAKAH